MLLCIMLTDGLCHYRYSGICRTVERCARRRTASLSAFMQSSVLFKLQVLWHLPSEHRLAMLKGIEASPDVDRKIGCGCPMAGVIRGYAPLCVAM